MQEYNRKPDKRNKNLVPCEAKENEEIFRLGIFEFIISRILEQFQNRILNTEEEDIEVEKGTAMGSIYFEYLVNSCLSDGSGPSANRDITIESIGSFYSPENFSDFIKSKGPQEMFFSCNNYRLSPFKSELLIPIRYLIGVKVTLYDI